MNLSGTLAAACIAAVAADACAKKTASSDPTAAGQSSASAESVEAPIACPPGTQVRGKTPPDGHRVWCATDNGISHGPYRAWHDSGDKRTEGAFRNGNAHGAWTHWHPGGAVRRQGTYKDGERVGTWRELDPEGRPVEAPAVVERRYDAGDRDRKESKYDAKTDVKRDRKMDVKRDRKMDVKRDMKMDVKRDRKMDVKRDMKMDAKRDTKMDVKRGRPAAIGVKECDRYVAFFTRCTNDHAPTAAQAQLMDALEKQAAAWRMAANGKSKDGLRKECRTALAKARRIVAAWGCK